VRVREEGGGEDNVGVKSISYEGRGSWASRKRGRTIVQRWKRCGWVGEEGKKHGRRKSREKVEYHTITQRGKGIRSIEYLPRRRSAAWSGYLKKGNVKPKLSS